MINITGSFSQTIDQQFITTIYEYFYFLKYCKNKFQKISYSQGSHNETHIRISDF